MDDRLTEIVRLLDPPSGFSLWHGGPSIFKCLEGIEVDQALWRPSPKRCSIWGYVLHIAYWKHIVSCRLTGTKNDFPRMPENFPNLPEHPTAENWIADKVLLKQEDTALLHHIRSLPAERLDHNLPTGVRIYDMLTGIAMHDAYHVAQIQLTKRLWEER